jgi:hypothetical protein
LRAGAGKNRGGPERGATAITLSTQQEGGRPARGWLARNNFKKAPGVFHASEDLTSAMSRSWRLFASIAALPIVGMTFVC